MNDPADQPGDVRDRPSRTAKPAGLMDRQPTGHDHPLARDPDGSGFWGWIDRRTEQVSGWLNPILIKEARQSLKSRQFLVTFFLLLAASCLWTVMGVISNAPDVYYLPTGNRLLAGYYFVLAVPLMGMVPLAAHRSLAAEIEENTFEMLAITRLTALRIVSGKLNSAMLQMVVYFAAIVPCIAFSYLLRGVSLPSIVLLVAIVFMTALLVTSLALLLATLAPNRASQTLATLAVVGVILVAQWMCAAACLYQVVSSSGQDIADAALGTAVYATMGISSVVLLIKAAAARIAPQTENRSTGLRWCMFWQQLLWIGVISSVALYYQDQDVLGIAALAAASYWMLMGALMMGESAILSPRVQRGLPSTFAARVLLTWFNPGPDTGYLFAVSTGSVGVLALGIFGRTVYSRANLDLESLNMAMVGSGYLMIYLGMTRIIVMPLARRFGPTLILPLTTSAVLLVLGWMTPFVISVALTGRPPTNYSLLQLSNWAWTIAECSRSAADLELALLVLMIGLFITASNLLLMFRAFRYRRVSVPVRVTQDQEHCESV